MRTANSNPRTRVAAIAGLAAALGSALVAAPPAQAADVFRMQYTSEYAQAYTSTMSEDGCAFSSISAAAGTAFGGGTTMFYSSSSFNVCTGEGYSVYGEAPTEVFTFERTSVHATATVPLSDGTDIGLDLTWQGTGTIERGGSTSRDILPGQFVQRTTNHGTIQEAVVSGTLSFENAYISASKGSSMTVVIASQ